MKFGGRFGVVAILVALHGCGGGGSSTPPSGAADAAPAPAPPAAPVSGPVSTPAPAPAPPPIAVPPPSPPASPSPVAAPVPAPAPSPAPSPAPIAAPSDSIPAGATLPATAAEGQLFYSTQDGQLYAYRGGNWVVNTPAVVIAHPPAPAQGTVAPSPVPTAIAVNAGGPALFAGVEQNFLADQYYVGGFQITPITAPIAGTALDSLYQTERWGEFSYVLPVVDGLYEVTIHQAEIFAGITAPEQRIFDVVLEPGKPGEYRIRNVDIWSAVGPLTAYDIVRTVRATGGTLVLDFRKIVQEPRVSAISVRPVSQASGNPKPVSELRDDVIRRLQGTQIMLCSEPQSAGYRPTIVAIDGTALRIGNDRIELSAAQELYVEALGTALTLSANVDAADGASYHINGWWSGDAISTLWVGGRYCYTESSASSGRWGDYDGDPARFLQSMPPAVSYRDVRLNCTFTWPLFGHTADSPYRSVYRVDFTDRMLTMTDLRGNTASDRGLPFVRPVGQSDYIQRSLRLDARNDLVTYGVSTSPRPPAVSASLTVDPGGVIRGASYSDSNRVDFRQTNQLSCPPRTS